MYLSPQMRNGVLAVLAVGSVLLGAGLMWALSGDDNDSPGGATAAVDDAPNTVVPDPALAGEPPELGAPEQPNSLLRVDGLASATTSPTSTLLSSTTSTATTATTLPTTGPTVVNGTDPSESSSTTAPTTAPTTTAAPATTTTAPQSSTTRSSGNAVFHRVTKIHTLTSGTVNRDTWTNGDITFFAPPGKVSPEVGMEWTRWYAQVDSLYRKISNDPEFDIVYRRRDPVNFAPNKKVLGAVSTCGAGCGNKTQAEIDEGFLNDMVANPTDKFLQGQWTLYYEMGRGGRHEPWYGRATWPTNTILMPHLMAGIAFHSFGGDAALEKGIVGNLSQGLRDWEAMDKEWVDHFTAADQQKMEGAPASHDLMAAMLYRVLAETDVDTVARVMDEMTNKSEAANATQAMCDFQDAVNSQTGGRFRDQMKGPWGLPDSCP